MAHDEWWTRDEDYARWCEEFNIYPNLDVCAKNRDAAKVKDNFITPDEDMLVTNWKDRKGNNLETVWFMNPPNSELKLSVRKALKEWKDNNLAGMMLIPANVLSRSYFEPVWQLIVKGVIKLDKDFKPLFKRPQFLENGVENNKGNRNDYMIIVFRKREWEKLE